MNASPGNIARDRWRLPVLSGVLCAFAAAVSPACAQAPQAAIPEQAAPLHALPHRPASRQMVGIEIRGTITHRTLEQLRQPLSRAADSPRDDEPFPAGVLILLDSAGGDGIAAMEIGRLARAARAHVFVAGRCSSACVLLFAGGAVRGAAAGMLGIHRGRVTRFVRDVGRQDVRVDTDEKARQFLELADRRTDEYLAEMGMPPSLFAAFLAVPSDRVRWLDAADIAQYGLAGMEPAYAASRAVAGAVRYGIGEDEFIRRSRETAEACRGDAATLAAFSACYRRVLATGR